MPLQKKQEGFCNKASQHVRQDKTEGRGTLSVQLQVVRLEQKELSRKYWAENRPEVQGEDETSSPRDCEILTVYQLLRTGHQDRSTHDLSHRRQPRDRQHCCTRRTVSCTITCTMTRTITCIMTCTAYNDLYNYLYNDLTVCNDLYNIQWPI